MKENTFYRLFVAKTFMFAIIFSTFSFFGKVWKGILSSPVMSLLGIFMFSLAMLIAKFSADISDPYYSPTTVWIFTGIMAILFISSTIALAKKKWRDWDPRNWK